MTTTKLRAVPVHRAGAAAALAGVLAFAVAPVPASAQQQDTAAVVRSVTATAEDLTVTLPAQITGDDMLDMEIVTADGDEVGEIVDLLIADDGSIDRAIAEVGGFLGIGERFVAIPLDRMTFDAEEEDDLIVDLGRTEIENLSSYEQVEQGWRPAPDTEG
jgi:hypothetical protein